MNTSHSGSTKDHHLDSERSLALRRAAKASFIGNFIEWFDYASYGYLVTVIGHAFFPEADKSVQLLSTYAVFAMSFILRPIGAVVWGAWGDRLDILHRSPSHLCGYRHGKCYRPPCPANDSGILRLR